MTICHRCNANNPSGTTYCANCGAKLLRASIVAAQPMTTTCQSCNTKNPMDSTFCFVCGTRLIKQEMIAQPAMVICPACQVANAQGSAFCSNCGVKLTGPAAEAQPTAIVCPNCRTSNLAGSTFCSNCGARLFSAKVNTVTPFLVQPVPAEPSKQRAAEHNWKAIVSLILGIIGIFAWLIPLIGYPVTIAGLVFGIIGLKSQKSGMAIGGMVLSIIFLMATVINSALGVLQSLESF